nr:hypothetical protein [Bacillaceae bacterium]
MGANGTEKGFPWSEQGMKKRAWASFFSGNLLKNSASATRRGPRPLRASFERFSLGMGSKISDAAVDQAPLNGFPWESLAFWHILGQKD